MPTERQRREAERRRLHRRLERRAQREARRRRFALIASVVGTLVVIGVVIGVVVATSNDHSNSAGGAPTTGTTPTAGTSPATSPPSSPPAAAYPCTWTKGGTAAKQVSVPPTTTPPKTGTVSVQVQSNRGTMTFRLDRAKAPCAVESFVSLVGQHYFDNTPCHRLTSGSLSVLQCGDPTGTGRGGPGYSFNDELTGNEKYTRGVLAMANSGPNTNGSQFFIVYKDSTLQPNYTIFGTVAAGMSVVDREAAHGSTPSGDGKPKLPITLTRLRVLR